MTRLYANEFKIITPPKGLEGIMPLKIAFETQCPDDDLFYDIQTEFDLHNLRRAIQVTEQELSEELPDHINPAGHPDVKLMRTAYQVLETRTYG